MEQKNIKVSIALDFTDLKEYLIQMQVRLLILECVQIESEMSDYGR